ncbi:MAG: hypothetical protein ACODAD_14655 [Planctomycetota bacterium]
MRRKGNATSTATVIVLLTLATTALAAPLTIVEAGHPRAAIVQPDASEQLAKETFQGHAFLHHCTDTDGRPAIGGIDWASRLEAIRERLEELTIEEISLKSRPSGRVVTEDQRGPSDPSADGGSPTQSNSP